MVVTEGNSDKVFGVLVKKDGPSLLEQQPRILINK